MKKKEKKRRKLDQNNYFFKKSLKTVTILWKNQNVLVLEQVQLIRRNSFPVCIDNRAFRLGGACQSHQHSHERKATI